MLYSKTYYLPLCGQHYSTFKFEKDAKDDPGTSLKSSGPGADDANSPGVSLFSSLVLASINQGVGEIFLLN